MGEYVDQKKEPKPEYEKKPPDWSNYDVSDGIADVSNFLR